MVVLNGLFMRNYLYSFVVLSMMLVRVGSAQDLIFKRVFDETLAQTSYILASESTREAIVVDPKRDIDTYLDFAKKENLKITKVTETHIHADFLSGAQELARATGAELLLSGETIKGWEYQIKHTPLHDKDKINLGKVIIEVMHTPGHTPESLTFLVTDASNSLKPHKALTGDFIFIGDVGRPDLLEKVAGEEGSQDEGAKQLFASIMRFSALPEEIEIWPGHGAGSFCGKSLSDEPQSTLKEEKKNNPALQFPFDEKGFVDYILSDQPTPPKYFSVMKQLNRVKRPLRVEVPKIPSLRPEELKEAISRGVRVIDTRARSTASTGFLPGSYLIQGSNSLSTFLGSVGDYQEQLVLIAEEPEVESLTRKLMRVGLDNIYGYVSTLKDYKGELLEADQVHLAEMKEYLTRDDVQVIDVRSEGEFNQGHISGAINIPFGELKENLDKIDVDKTVIIQCLSGARATIGYSVLKAEGLDQVKVYVDQVQELFNK